MEGRRRETRIARGQGRSPRRPRAEGNASGDPREERRKGRGQGGEWETTGARAGLSQLRREETGPRGPSGVTGGWGGLQLGADNGEGPKSWARGRRQPGTTAGRPESERREATAARSPDPSGCPLPTPLRAWRPGRVGRLGADLPLTSAACRPASPTRTDLSRPPLAPPPPPPPSRGLRRLLPKLFPLIPAPPRGRHTQRRPAPPPRA